MTAKSIFNNYNFLQFCKTLTRSDIKNRKVKSAVCCCATLDMPDKFKFKVNIIITLLPLPETISSGWRSKWKTAFEHFHFELLGNTHCQPVIQSFHLHIINFVQHKVMFCFVLFWYVTMILFWDIFSFPFRFAAC